MITFYGAPFGFPSEDPLPIHLVLMVTAHHGERDHLLGEGQGLWSGVCAKAGVPLGPWEEPPRRAL